MWHFTLLIVYFLKSSTPWACDAVVIDVIASHRLYPGRFVLFELWRVGRCNGVFPIKAWQRSWLRLIPFRDSAFLAIIRKLSYAAWRKRIYIRSETWKLSMKLVVTKILAEIGIHFLPNKWFNSWTILFSSRKFRKYLLIIDGDRSVLNNSLEMYYIFQKIIFFRDP